MFKDTTLYYKYKFIGISARDYIICLQTQIYFTQDCHYVMVVPFKFQTSCSCQLQCHTTENAIVDDYAKKNRHKQAGSIQMRTDEIQAIFKDTFQNTEVLPFHIDQQCNQQNSIRRLQGLWVKKFKCINNTVIIPILNAPMFPAHLCISLFSDTSCTHLQ